MAKLQYTFKTDVLFKLLFTKYPDLLKRLVTELLDIAYESIERFDITNPNITPEELGEKFCRLDINMKIDSQIVDLEIQVSDEGNYPERALFYWARDFSTGISEGEDYALLPRTIIISILGFNQFNDPIKYHSEYQVLDIINHEPLTDKMVLHFFELDKLPPLDRANCNRDLWLQLFNSETEEDLNRIERMGVKVMREAIAAYHHIAASDELRNLERMRSKARHDEAQALKNAERKRDEHWQAVISEARHDEAQALKNAERKRDEHWQTVISDKDAEIINKDAEIINKDAEIARLRALINKL